jgi:hypothetical protein
MRERLSNQASVTITADNDGRQLTLTDGASQVSHAAALPAWHRELAPGRRCLVGGCQLRLDSWPTIELAWLPGTTLA